MNIYEKQYFLNYTADGGEPYFVFNGEKKTKSQVLESLLNLGYLKTYAELLIETGYAFEAIYDVTILRLHIKRRLEEENMDNWYLGKAGQEPHKLKSYGLTAYWEMVECLYENGLTWENAREEVFKGRYEKIMKEKGRNIDDRPRDLSGWDSLYDHAYPKDLNQQMVSTREKYPNTREQTIDVIKMLISFGYSSVMAQIFAAEGIATQLLVRGDFVYASIKESLRNKTSNVWYGLNEALIAPYMVSPEGMKGTYFDFINLMMEEGESLKSAMRIAENIPPNDPDED